jgi:aldehyde:ferredoxin oxidoreductase
MFKGGYLGKILRVHLTTKKYTVEALQEEDLLKLLGGRGIAAKMYYREIGPEVKPLDPENKLIFMTGPLTGVKLPSTTKFQLATKSPETGIYLCSNCGGDFGPQLKQCGFDGLIIEGRADDWTYLEIRDGDVKFGDARSMKGMSTHETLEALKNSFGDKRAAALSIGPAAERLVRFKTSEGYCNKRDRKYTRCRRGKDRFSSQGGSGKSS